MASNHQEIGFFVHASFRILWSRWSVYKNISSTGVVDRCILLHIHIPISQPELSMEIIIKQSLSLMWFNKVPLKKNNAEDSKGVLHQRILSVWSRLNVCCTTAQRILNYAAYAFSCLKHACAILQIVGRKDLCVTLWISYGQECWKLRLLSFMCYVSFIIFSSKKIPQLIKWTLRQQRKH